MKVLRIKELKPKGQKFKPTNFFGYIKTSKKRFEKEKRKQKNSNFGISAIRINIISNKIRPKDLNKDISKIMY